MQNQAKNLGHRLKRQHSYSLPMRSFWERLNFDDVWRRQNIGDLVEQSQTLDGQRIWPQSWEGRSSPWNQSLQRLWHFLDRKVFSAVQNIYVQSIAASGHQGQGRDCKRLNVTKESAAAPCTRMVSSQVLQRNVRSCWSPGLAATWLRGQWLSRLSSIGFAQSRTEHLKSLLLTEDRVSKMSLFWTWNRAFSGPE